MKIYKAIDRRVYNGTLCPDMQRERNHTEYLIERMRKADKTSSCTYFPMEGQFLTFTNSNILENPDLKGSPKILTGNFWPSKQEALIEAIRILEG